ncbi:MAG: hypothetical protein A3G64_00315 [Candidatus Liptonbacteria bacterium RIFCSPLOWO2_12_FULL_60_15]|uniref:DUF5671 domain-containing protein n=2 Tax=Candidatus Liptoniibacteriota TaxID=1817909 RepID=A0A1G2CKC3_9BACT|nr:MAG: hypothetical protein A3E09_01755 [Candidatus Liptonbacteria bacterium RIFCSPHIGHO2_12_FULL_60_13]OGZ01799.1 MAG: hypothetical protein A3G64_00315 [Candidatus Liptonbacteria bacterium RIFCSPLOWO2_12_FULL_60_15]
MEQAQRSSPRDLLTHLFVMAGLYVSAGMFLSLVFGLVDAYLPDLLTSYYDPASGIRWSLATLTVVFPVFVWGSWFLAKDIAANAWKGELRIRKWLVYITLFAAAALVIGDLVSLLYNFLGGELSGRFLLKTLAVFAVGAAVFTYYLYDLRRSALIFSPRMKVFVIAACLVVAAVVVTGFAVAGSPFRQRLVRFDQQKVSNLQTIQGQTVYFWQQKERLPQSLDELRDPISGFTAPRDPQSGAAYEYRATGALSFELCAEFNLSSKDALNVPKPEPLYYPYPGGVTENWDHAEGRACFARSIDPELYAKPLR